MDLHELRNNCSLKQKKGLHFIIASIIIWMAILCVHLTQMPILTKNPINAIIIFDFKNNKGGFSKQGESAYKFGYFVFSKSDGVFADCNVDISNYSRENGYGIGNDFRGSFDAL